MSQHEGKDLNFEEHSGQGIILNKLFQLVSRKRLECYLPKLGADSDDVITFNLASGRFWPSASSMHKYCIGIELSAEVLKLRVLLLTKLVLIWSLKMIS